MKRALALTLVSALFAAGCSQQAPVLRVEPLGAGVEAAVTAGHESEIIKALNAHAKFLRGQLGRHIDMKFTPDLRFRHDESFDTASHIDRLFDDPRVRADVERIDDHDED